MTLPRYPKYKDSGVEWLGQVPAHWPVAALAYRYEVALGKMLDARQIAGNHLKPYVRNADVQWGSINANDLNEMDFEPRERDRFALRKGDLLVCEGGEVGRCAVWESSVDECYYQKALHRLRPYDARRDDARCFQWILHAAVHSGGFAADEAKTTIAHLPAEAFRRHRFAFPPLPEQAAIAAFLDRETVKIDALVAEQERLIELLKEKRQAVISHAVTKGLNRDAPMKDSGVEWLGEIPAHWGLERGRFLYRKLELPPERNDGVVTAFRDGQVTLRENRRTDGFTIAVLEGGYQRVREGDLVLHGMDAFAGAIGVSESTGKCTPEYSVLTPLRDDVVNSYFAMVLRLMAQRNFILVICPSVRERAPRFRFEAFREVVLPVPPLGEQREILALIESGGHDVRALTAEAKRAIDLLQERRSSLISAAVTGQIDVRNIAGRAA